jgi:sorbitol-specific phosphotransferase system component IIC
MKLIDRSPALYLLAALLCVLMFVEPFAARTLQRETPEKFKPATESFDYIKLYVVTSHVVGTSLPGLSEG